MKLSRLKILGSFCLAVLLSASAWASPSTANTALPGTLNYVEGQAAISGQPVTTKSIGQVTLETGQTLDTAQGKAEVLLTPGVFLRLGDHSSAKMISPELTNTQVEIQGRAMVEVAEIYKQNDLRIIEDGIPTQLLKNGLYSFDSSQNQVQVFKGKAIVFDGDREIKVDGGHEVDLNSTGKIKATKFDKKKYEESDLYRWSSLRSEYLSEANVETARVYIDNGWWGPGWGWGAGWFWSPWYGAYTFFPGDGAFFSPFGWGFYAPVVVYRSPGFWGRGVFVHDFNSFAREPHAAAPRVVAHSGFAGGGFARGGLGESGGHISGTGFHGGGFGGGRR